ASALSPRWILSEAAINPLFTSTEADATPGSRRLIGHCGRCSLGRVSYFSIPSITMEQEKDTTWKICAKFAQPCRYPSLRLAAYSPGIISSKEFPMALRQLLQLIFSI